MPKTYVLPTLVGIILISILLIAATVWSAPTVVRMSQPTEALSFLTVYAARANRFFEDEGITLELIIMQGGGPELQALIAGSVDFSATGTAGLIRAFSGGVELLGVQNILGRCVVDLVIRKDSANRLGIRPEMPVEEKLRRLKGAKVGASRIGALTYQIPFFLAKESGLEPGKDVTILGVGGGASQLASFKTGHIDVMSSSPPWPAAAIKGGEGLVLVANTRGEYPKLRSFLQQLLLVRPEFARNNPDLVRRVVRALVRGNRWVAENSPQEIAKAIAKFFKQTPPDVLVGTVEAIKPAVVSDGKITVDGLRGVEAVLRANGIVKQTVSWDRLVTNDFLPN
jgi:NitT/TauT family transport system substrate-binding protein